MSFPLLSLCDDLLLCVADQFDSEASLSNLARTNIRLYALLNQYLYRHNARFKESSAVIKAIENDLPRNTLLYALRAYSLVGSQVKLRDWTTKTILSNTFFNGYESICTLLVENGHYDITEVVTDDQQKALSVAAMLGYLDIVKMLVKVEGVDVNEVDRTGKTPLFWAARRRHAKVVRFLLKHEDIKVNATDRDRETPLLWACRRGFRQVVKALLTHSDVDPNMSNHEGETPLSVAISVASSVDIVRQLVQHKKTDVNLAMPGNKEPFLIAVERGRFKIVKQLLQCQSAGMDIYRTDGQGRTALSLAAAHGHYKILRLLLDSTTIDVNSQDTAGMNALHHAATQDNKSCVERLLRHPDVNPNSTDLGGRTALFHAIKCHNTNAVRVLLHARGIDPNHKDDTGCSVLIYSVCRPFILEEILKLLLQVRHLDVNAVDSLGRSALTWCCKRGLGNIAKLLFTREDIKTSKKDGDGCTPLAWAMYYGDQAMIRLIRRRRLLANFAVVM